jgi:hypothetical protein
MYKSKYTRGYSGSDRMVVGFRSIYQVVSMNHAHRELYFILTKAKTWCYMYKSKYTRGCSGSDHMILWLDLGLPS